MLENIFSLGIEKVAKGIKQTESSYTIPSHRLGNKKLVIPEGKHEDDSYFTPFVNTSVIDTNTPKTEIELIKAYRELAKASDVDEAVKEIINETFSGDGREECFRPMFKPDTKIQASTQNKITEAFKYVYHNLFDFDKNGQKYFRQWYVDGRIAFHIAVDKKQNTITSIRPLDVLATRKVTIEYYNVENGLVDEKKTKTIYLHIPSTKADKEALEDMWIRNNPRDFIYKFDDNAIAWADSGIVDPDANTILSHLYKAIIPYNNLKMMEESMIIYRIVRAPERRAFYIDVGGMGSSKAMQYVHDIKNTFNNKTFYDSSTNSFVNRKTVHSMVEDYYLPRRDGQKGTQIETIGGAENLGVTKDIEYLRDKFYRALNVPGGRLNPELQQSMLMLGRVTEMNRDEYRFKRFIDELRRNFIPCIEKVLKTELILRNITTEEDWNNKIQKDLFWDYIEDNSFTEIKKSEKIRAKLEILDSINQYVGEYFSKNWVRKEILGFSDDEIKTMQKEMDDDVENGEPDGEEDDVGVGGGNTYTRRLKPAQQTSFNSLGDVDMDDVDDADRYL